MNIPKTWNLDVLAEFYSQLIEDQLREVEDRNPPLHQLNGIMDRELSIAKEARVPIKQDKLSKARKYTLTGMLYDTLQHFDDDDRATIEEKVYDPVLNEALIALRLNPGIDKETFIDAVQQEISPLTSLLGYMRPLVFLNLIKDYPDLLYADNLKKSSTLYPHRLLHNEKRVITEDLDQDIAEVILNEFPDHLKPLLEQISEYVIRRHSKPKEWWLGSYAIPVGVKIGWATDSKKEAKLSKKEARIKAKELDALLEANNPAKAEELERDVYHTLIHVLKAIPPVIPHANSRFKINPEEYDIAINIVVSYSHAQSFKPKDSTNTRKYLPYCIAMLKKFYNTAVAVKPIQ